MSSGLPIWIVEPDQTEKRADYAGRVSLKPLPSPDIAQTLTVEELKARIKKVRQNARDNIKALVTRLEATLRERYPNVKVTSAFDYKQAVSYICRNAGGNKIISTNNSVSVQELKPALAEAGFSIINSYRHEFTVAEKKVGDYYDLPRLLDRGLKSTFDVVLRMDGLPSAESKQYLALLGVNAVSADDGTVLFLEHFANINKDLVKANRVFLVIGLDKIVGTRDEALLQTKCMGVFGMENILLGIEPRQSKGPSIEELPLPPAGDPRELHVIILDNGRSNLLGGKFADLFLCIGCRACNKHCPIRHQFASAEDIWTPKVYLNQFLFGGAKSVDVCLHCEACHVECPVDIDIPYLMWQAKLDYVAQHGTSLSHKVLGRPEWLAKLGTAAGPLSNWMMRQKVVRVPMEKAIGIDRRTTLPEFHFRTFRRRAKRNG